MASHGELHSIVMPCLRWRTIRRRIRGFPPLAQSNRLMYLMVFLNVIIHGCLTGSRVVMVLLAIELGANMFEIGVMVALYSALPLLLGVYSARMSDRYGVRLPMLFGAVLLGCGLLGAYLWRHLGAVS